MKHLRTHFNLLSQHTTVIRINRIINGLATINLQTLHSVPIIIRHIILKQ